MAEADDLHEGDEVTWNTSQGRTSGHVVETRTEDFDIEGTHLKASEDEPKLVVESDRTGARAGHNPSALDKEG